MLRGEELVDAEPGHGREVGEGDDLALGVPLDDDDLAVSQPPQAERVVGRGEELHAREHLPQARHDPHPPARMEVRAELVDQHRALGGLDASASCRRSVIIRSVASATTDW